MEQTSFFKNNRLQAVNLPKTIASPESVSHVEVIGMGRTRLIVPTHLRGAGIVKIP